MTQDEADKVYCLVNDTFMSETKVRVHLRQEGKDCSVWVNFYNSTWPIFNIYKVKETPGVVQKIVDLLTSNGALCGQMTVDLAGKVCGALHLNWWES